MSELKLVVAGASGRMGRTLIREIAQGSGITLCGALEMEGHPNLGMDSGTLSGMQPNGIKLTADPLPVIAGAQGIVDFTTPMVSLMLADLAAQARIVHVIGTTGFDAKGEERIKAAARHGVIVKSGNMSMGVNLLAALVERAARSLPDYDIEVLEMHHRNKVDAPSGTALLLGQAAARGRDIALEKHWVKARDGHDFGARADGAIGFATLRGGTVVGEHSVIFAGSGERITLTHTAEDRTIFAHGALAAAKWGHGQKPGLYSMTDVLGALNSLSFPAERLRAAMQGRTQAASLCRTTPKLVFPCGRFPLPSRAASRHARRGDKSGELRMPKAFSKAEAEEFFARLKKRNPSPKTELEYTNPYTLLVAVALSAQATDKGVNKATMTLFQKVQTPEAMLELGEAGLTEYIKTIGLYRGKAKNVIAAAKLLVEKHGGKVPNDQAALEELPGVGRKTANVVRNVAFGEKTIAVDTHIFRVCNRTGLAPGKDVLAVELALEKIVPDKYALHAHHWLILHGRYTCIASKPLCPVCVVRDLCRFKDKTKELPPEKARAHPAKNGFAPGVRAGAKNASSRRS